MSILRWLLYPINCDFPADDTISSWMQKPDGVCTPFGSPELGVTLPALLLTILFVVYSLVTTLLSFEVNPLSQVLCSACSGPPGPPLALSLASR